MLLLSSLPVTALDNDNVQPTQEAWYFVRSGNTFKRRDITGESLELEGRMEVDPALRESLTDEAEGILRPGALPSITGATAAGSKAILDAVDKAG